jgi:hypothetical protein
MLIARQTRVFCLHEPGSDPSRTELPLDRYSRNHRNLIYRTLATHRKAAVELFYGSAAFRLNGISLKTTLAKLPSCRASERWPMPMERDSTVDEAHEDEPVKGSVNRRWRTGRTSASSTCMRSISQQHQAAHGITQHGILC